MIISDEIDKLPIYSLLLTLEGFDVNGSTQDTSPSLIGTSPSSSMPASVLVIVSISNYEKKKIRFNGSDTVFV